MSDHETYFDSLIGKRVLVIWHDARNDWIAFRLIWEDCGNVKLQGVESPDGNRHDGSCVIFPVSDIRDMIEWKEEIDNHEHKPYYYIYRVGNGNSSVKHSTIESAQKEVERLERELEQERQDRKQADLDTIRALGDRNEARAEVAVWKHESKRLEAELETFDQTAIEWWCEYQDLKAKACQT